MPHTHIIYIHTHSHSIYTLLTHPAHHIHTPLTHTRHTHTTRSPYTHTDHSHTTHTQYNDDIALSAQADSARSGVTSDPNYTARVGTTGLAGRRVPYRET